MKIVIYGCRGSTPTSKKETSVYGGNTCCMTVEANGEYLIIDAGSGIIDLQSKLEKEISDFPMCNTRPIHMLISHLHIEHILGLSTFRPCFAKNASFNIYTKNRGNSSLKEQIFGIFKPPYWPVDMSKVSSANCIEIDETPFKIGNSNLTIYPFIAAHPDVTQSFRITDGEKTVIYLLDFEIKALNIDGYDELVKMCENADLIVFDATYAVNDYEKHAGYGHSTQEEGIKLLKDSNSKKLLLTHYSYSYNDAEITSWTNNLDKDMYILAQDGMEIVL